MSSVPPSPGFAASAKFVIVTQAEAKRNDTVANALWALPALQGLSRSDLSVLPPLGFNNTFAILVRERDAEALELRTIGDLQKVAARWTAGFGYEFIERADGYRGLSAAYGVRFAREPRVMDLNLIYRAVASSEIVLPKTKGVFFWAE